MVKTIDYVFDVGKEHVRLRRFDQENVEVVEKICNENLDEILRLWNLDREKERHIDLYYVNSTTDVIVYLSSTIFGVAALVLVIITIITLLMFGLFSVMFLWQLLFSFLITILILLIYFQKALKDHREQNIGLTVPGISEIKISIDGEWKSEGFSLEEVVTHELYHALSMYLGLPSSFLSEGIAQVTTKEILGETPFHVLRDDNGYFLRHQEYYFAKRIKDYICKKAKKKFTNNQYVILYWVVSYLREVHPSTLEKVILNPKTIPVVFRDELGIQCNLLRTLNELAYVYFYPKYIK